jgi:hypothetical protein
VQCQKRLDSSWCRNLGQKTTTISLWGHVASISAVVPKGVDFCNTARAASGGQSTFMKKIRCSDPG